ncbi:trehalose-phosphatase [Phenylobacterium sp.]|uniref:trehalose-phosphatase n=1 Tax=Phenylobacterium sp. TaxID=1871053 RepID=UPI0027332AAE|nr:trehalose-phosphatase [Phenylobacterium sp.]MDP3658512.1 trehalose-phosphatase [Phenylobacterium sp.]
MGLQELSIGMPPPALKLSGTALFLDLDGTLAQIAARPQDVVPDPRRTSLLERLAIALDGRLAVISGRALADVDRILEGRVAAVAAVHGLVRRDADGRIHAAAVHPGLLMARSGFERFAARDAGLIVEDKGPSVALHFRQAPALAQAAGVLAGELAAATGLMRQDGHMVVELRTPGPDKGDALAAFLKSAPFAGAQPVFVGDDQTDEDGFVGAEVAGGFGVLVGPERRSHARWRLDDVDAALAWLEASL